MPTRRAACLFPLLLALAIAGCSSQEEPTPTTTIAPPPPSAGVAPPVVATVDTPTSTDTGATNNTTPPTTGNTGAGETAIGTPTATVSADGSLAPYAAALAIVQPDHFAVVKIDMAALRKSPLLQSMPGDPEQMAAQLPIPGAPSNQAAADMAKQLEHVEAVWVSFGPPQMENAPFSLAIYAHCASPEVAIGALAAMNAKPETAHRLDHEGIALYISKAPGGPKWAVRGSDVFVSTEESTVRSALSAGGKVADADLLKKLAAAKLDAPVVIAGSFGPFKAPLSLMAVEALKNSPIPLSPALGKLPQQIDFAVIAIDPDAEAIIDIDADMDADQSAENFKTSLEGIVSLAKILIGQQAAQAAEAGAISPEDKQSLALAQAALDAVTVSVNAQHVDASFNRFAELSDLPVLLARQIEQAATISHMNDARFLGLAAHNHRDATRRWPHDVKSGAGVALLSWRYELLPYVEEEILHREFQNQEPWDSATNLPLAAPMPEVFRTPSATEPSTTTWKMLADDHPSGVMLLDTGKGTATPWTKPDEFTLDAANPLASLGEEPAGGYIIVNRDGSVARLPRTELIAKLGGEPGGVDETPPDFKLTVAEFVKAFEDDQDAANARFENKKVELTGKLGRFNVSHKGGCDIYLDDKKWATVHIEPWALALPGQTVTARGVVEGSFAMTIVDVKGPRTTLAAADLAKQYARNAEATGKKYQGRWMEVRGTVTGKTPNELGGAELVLAGAGPTNVRCLVAPEFHESLVAIVANIKVGDTVRIAGVYDQDLDVPTITQGKPISRAIEDMSDEGDETPANAPATENRRSWASADGKFTVEAELVKVVGPTVHLKRANGQVVQVPRDKLSEADQEYIRTLKRGM